MGRRRTKRSETGDCFVLTLIPTSSPPKVSSGSGRVPNWAFSWRLGPSMGRSCLIELESMRQGWEDARAGGSLAVFGKASSVVPHRPLAIGIKKKKKKNSQFWTALYGTAPTGFAGTAAADCDHGTKLPAAAGWTDQGMCLLALTKPPR